MLYNGEIVKVSSESFCTISCQSGIILWEVKGRLKWFMCGSHVRKRTYLKEEEKQLDTFMNHVLVFLINYFQIVF